ncbi:hypothetical protein ARTHRO9V_230066 [Arthrobacter sp. 9V]|nr:hypothetical protein ARTHRO9V_230066 [Arthrobacter sp. 9V]
MSCSKAMRLFPPRVEDAYRNGALVARTEVLLLDQFGNTVGDVAALKVIVNLVVRNAELVLVGAAGLVVQEVSGRNLLPEAGGGAQLGQDCAVLALVQAEQRKDIRTAVAVLGEEASDGLGAMIGTDHQVIVFTGEGVLGDHAGAGLGVALVEIGDFGAGGLLELVLKTINGRGDIERPLGLGLDEIQGCLSVVLVVLDAVGESHGHEVRVHALRRKLFHGELGKPPGKGGIEPAGNSQDKALGTCRFDVVLQEGDPFADLLRRIDPGLDAHFFNDLGLEFAHAPTLVSMVAEAQPYCTLPAQKSANGQGPNLWNRGQ